MTSTEKTYAVMERSESESADLLNIQRAPPTNEQAQDDLLYNHKERAKNLTDEEQLIKLSTDANFVKTVVPRKIFYDKGC